MTTTFKFTAVFSRRENMGEGDTRHREQITAASLTEAFAEAGKVTGWGELVGIVEAGSRINF